MHNKINISRKPKIFCNLEYMGYILCTIFRVCLGNKAKHKNAKEARQRRQKKSYLYTVITDQLDPVFYTVLALHCHE
jgi:hypothetical protein